MSSLDDELALFDAEINSLVEDEPSSSASNVQIGHDMHGNGTAGLAGTSVPGFISSVNVPILINPIMPLAASAAFGAAGLMLPHQLRHHPSAAVQAPPPVPATIESKPQLYAPATSGPSASKMAKKEEEAPKVQEFKTLALPADVELNELKKARERNNQHSILGKVQRGERKMKRFVRCAGGETWEDPSLAEWDPNDFRIFCGDLGNEVSDELLGKAFRKYPTFQKAKVCRDSKTNKSKGFGFVSFKSQEDFIRAMREMDGKYVGNRPVKLRKSNWKERNLDTVKKKQKQKKKLGLI